MRNPDVTGIMRITDRPCSVTVADGVVHFECDGVHATLDPAAAKRAGGHFIDLAAEERPDSDANDFAERTGKLLLARAAEASQQRAVPIAA